MRKLVLLIATLHCVNLNAQKSNFYISSWLEVSDNGSQISAEKFFCDNKGKICYFIFNDNNNISIDLRIDDVIVQNRILVEGLTVWINMDGKRTKNLGIRFPIGSRRTAGRNTYGQELPGLDPDGTLITPLDLANSIEIIGFKGESERRFPSENADNFRGSVRYVENGILYYRLILPVSRIPVRNSKDSNGALPFNLGVEYGEVQSPTSKPPVLVWIKNIRLATRK